MKCGEELILRDYNGDFFVLGKHVPGMTANSLVPKSASALMSMQDLVLRIISLSLARRAVKLYLSQEKNPERNVWKEVSLAINPKNFKIKLRSGYFRPRYFCYNLYYFLKNIVMDESIIQKVSITGDLRYTSRQLTDV